MPPVTAAFLGAQFASIGILKGTFEAFHLQTCSSGSPLQHKYYPLVSFSSGLSASRLNYNVVLQWIPSLGFSISIENPYDTGVVEFPDSTIIRGANISNPSSLFQDLSVRVADARCVLDASSSPSTLNFLPRNSSWLLHFNTNKTVMFGRSLGGAMAADAILDDGHFFGGMDLTRRNIMRLQITLSW